LSYLIDSDWLIDAAIGCTPALQLIGGLATRRPAISTISVAEVCEGAFGASEPAEALARVQTFLAGFVVLPVTTQISEQSAWLRFTLRRQGMLIPDMDLLIAATALEHDLTLVTRNERHFARIPGLQLQ
jgi:predicted nucleic acid-binding protein